MKFHTSYILINTKKRKEIINITEKIIEVVRKSGIQEGPCLINSMHITSSVFINDEESGLKQDFLEWLEKTPQKIPLIGIIKHEKIMQMPISNAQLWAEK